MALHLKMKWLLGVLPLAALTLSAALSPPSTPGSVMLQSRQLAVAPPAQSHPHPTGMFHGWFVNGTTGWMVTVDHGRHILSRTDNGGNSFVRQLDIGPTRLSQRDISFVDENTGFLGLPVLGSADITAFAMLATTDGGTSWARRSVPRQGALGGLDFITKYEGWILEVSPTLKEIVSHTADGGSSWTTCSQVGLESGDHLEGIRFTDPLHGWISGWSNNSGLPVYYETGDGCSSWSRRVVDPGWNAVQHRVLVVDPPVVGAGGDIVGILSSVVGSDRKRMDLYSRSSSGSTWSFTASSEAMTVPALTTTGIVVSYAGRTLYASDFVDSRIGFAESVPSDSSRRVLLTTHDAGLTWSVASFLDS